jgi:hypothetical protein
MKSWVALILVMITAAGTFVPCCGVDDCCAGQFAASSNQEKHQAEGTCSPFFACAACPGFVELVNRIQLVQPLFAKQVHHERMVNHNLTTYFSSFWQPPRSC